MRVDKTGVLKWAGIVATLIFFSTLYAGYRRVAARCTPQSPGYCDPSTSGYCTSPPEQCFGNCCVAPSAPPSGGCACGRTCTSECKKDCVGGVQGDWCGYTNTGGNKFICDTCSCNTCAACTATPPTGVTITQPKPYGANNPMQITWSQGTLGNYQLIRAGEDYNEVMNGCPGNLGTPCVVATGQLPNSQTSYTSGNVFLPDKLYYFRVVNVQSLSPACYPDIVATATTCGTVQPTITSITTNGANQTVVSWNPVAGGLWLGQGAADRAGADGRHAQDAGRVPHRRLFALR